MNHAVVTDASVALKWVLPDEEWAAQAASLPSLYDSLYVVLAEVVNTELWTADQTLVRALGDSARWVRSIGDYPLPA